MSPRDVREAGQDLQYDNIWPMYVVDKMSGTWISFRRVIDIPTSCKSSWHKASSCSTAGGIYHR